MPGPPTQTTLAPEQMAAVQGSTAAMQDVKGFGLAMLQNRWNRKYNERMYDKQRQHALEDWQRAADYNSPQAQMQRYKEAGLNPNLIYGSATNSPMAQMKGPTQETSEMPPYQLNRNAVGEAIGTYQNLKLIQQQVDNLSATNEQIRANTNYINLKALTEIYNPGLVQAKTGTEYGKQSLMQQQGEGIAAKVNLDVQKYNFLSQMNPHLQKLVTERINNIVADTGLKGQQTNVQSGLVQLNAQRLLTEVEKTAKTKQEKDNLKQAWYALNGEAFKAGIEKIYNSFGTSFKDNYMTRNATSWLGTPEAVNRVYRSIVPGWDKKSDKEKAYYLHQESLNYK
jgi:hypothetical protein